MREAVLQDWLQRDPDPRTRAELEALMSDLADLRTYYAVDASYASPSERLQTLELFEQAMERLRRRLERKGEE